LGETESSAGSHNQATAFAQCVALRTQEHSEMDRHLFDRRRLLRQAALAASAMFSPPRSNAAEPAGVVEDVRGEAFAEANSVRRMLAQAAPLFLNEEVGTGHDSRLGMRLGRDTILRLGQEARVKIDRFLVDAGGEITLEAGPLLFDRPGPRGSDSTRIRTPFGLIAVRGTRFFAGPSSGRFGVFVERGIVAVTAARRQVVLHSGEGTDFDSPGAAPTPVKRWQPPRIRAAFESVE
jgi:ferric-dicitrate binding protein FerR (iron transport regulator)